MYIPRGQYLTVEQYRLKIGGVARSTILKAIKQGRLKGAIQIDSKTIIIPESAVLFNGSIKSGKYIGQSAWLRGEIEHQTEAANWEMKQEQLRKMRGEDSKGLKDTEAYHDYD